MSRYDLEHYCELIAALKLRTTNRAGRHLSTGRAIQLLEEFGVETAQGLVRAPAGLLSVPTVNRWLSLYRLDQPRLLREPPATRFQADYSNDCWQFDMSPSDLKHIDRPEWVDPARGEPTLMLFSVVDDRSGVAWQEYRCVYGEDAESALRFLFNAMSAKTRPDCPFRGRPKMLYLDNGPVAKSRVFRNVMQALQINWQTHVPAGKDGTRTTARAKGKVERPFRTVKEAHETLYHFHKPETEQQANEWLWNYLLRYNAQRHRSEKHSRLEDWLTHLPEDGLRDMCSWEQYCRFAREPESRRVGVDARVTIDGTVWEVEPDMAGETVTLLWGLFDDEILAERADRIHALASQLNLPVSALSGGDLQLVSDSTPSPEALPHQPFISPVSEYQFPSVIQAKLAIADDQATPLARMSDEARAVIDSILADTLIRSEVLGRVREYFRNRQSGEDHAG